MACKAAAFADAETLVRLTRCATPLEAKCLGRQVRGFNKAEWDSVVQHVAFIATFQKFAQVPGIAQSLIFTGSDILAEASERDTVWGIGRARDDPLAMVPDQWRGTNYLGIALMQVRELMGGQASQPGYGKNWDASCLATPVPQLKSREGQLPEGIWGKPVGGRPEC